MVVGVDMGSMKKHTVLENFKKLHTSAYPFPGSNPVSIERDNYQTLLRTPYWVCEKTDGIRYMLYMDTIESQKVSFLINRRLDIERIRITVPDAWYNGTLLDGELTEDMVNHSKIFLVFDVLAVAGTNHVHEESFIKRWRFFADSIESLAYHHDDKDSFAIVLKQFFKLKDISRFERYLENIRDRFKTDGLILTPEKQVITPGRNMQMFKWKESKNNTCDFFIKICSNKVMAHVYDLKNKKLHFVCEVDKTPDMESGDVYECSYVDKKWVPKIKRTDKKYPNDLNTFTKTLLNIEENIKFHEFKAIASRIT